MACTEAKGQLYSPFLSHPSQKCTPAPMWSVKESQWTSSTIFCSNKEESFKPTKRKYTPSLQQSISPLMEKSTLLVAFKNYHRASLILATLFLKEEFKISGLQMAAKKLGPSYLNQDISETQKSLFMWTQTSRYILKKFNAI